MKTILNNINKYIEKSLLNYIDKVSRTLYPKSQFEEEDDDDDEPILFI